MKRSTRCLLTAAASLSLAAFAAPATAQTSGDVPSYSEFKSSTYQDTDRQWIVNGDQPVATESALQKFYEAMVSPKTNKEGLIINTISGRDDKWTQDQVGNLTYCVSDAFGDDKDEIVDAIGEGASLWEKASSAIDYIYDDSQDASCDTSNESVVFSVEPAEESAPYVARAFSPSTEKEERNVLINAKSLLEGTAWTPGNFLGHELGHTLGFGHEHTRPEAGVCADGSEWRPLTPYDSASIMHYPQCNGSSKELSFSERDGEGVRAVYGS